MTNADFVNSRPEMPAGAIIEAAERWYAMERTGTDSESAGLLVKLAAWLAAEHTDAPSPETTVVTTLTVTHVLREADADAMIHRGVPQRIAEACRAACARGFSAMSWAAQPDNLTVGNVQVFGLDGMHAENGGAGSEA